MWVLLSLLLLLLPFLVHCALKKKKFIRKMQFIRFIKEQLLSSKWARWNARITLLFRVYVFPYMPFAIWNLIKQAPQTLVRTDGLWLQWCRVSLDLLSPSGQHSRLFESSLFSQTLNFPRLLKWAAEHLHLNITHGVQAEHEKTCPFLCWWYH